MKTLDVSLWPLHVSVHVHRHVSTHIHKTHTKKKTPHCMPSKVKVLELPLAMHELARQT